MNCAGDRASDDDFTSHGDLLVTYILVFRMN